MLLARNPLQIVKILVQSICVTSEELGPSLTIARSIQNRKTSHSGQNIFLSLGLEFVLEVEIELPISIGDGGQNLGGRNISEEVDLFRCEGHWGFDQAE